MQKNQSTDESVPTLTVPINVWQKLQAYVELCPIEINGFGVINQIGPDDFELEDVFIFEQTASDVHVTVSAEVMHSQLYQLSQTGLDLSTIRFQWHSHVSMGAYMSSTDLDNIESYPGDWMISLVINKFGDFEVRLDVLRPLRLTLPVSVVLEANFDEALLAELKDEILEKVKDEDGRLLRKGRDGGLGSQTHSMEALQLIHSESERRTR